MSETIRVFAGIEAAAEPLRGVLARLGTLGKAVRPLREDQLHVTLKFFGVVDAAALPALADGLTVVARGTEPFDWRVVGTGAFPSPSRPSVVWAGVAPGERFAPLAEALEAVGERAGVPRERRPYTPHVTLARVKFRPPPELAAFLRETADTDFGPRRAEHLVLYRSDLAPGGSIYTPLHIAILGTGTA